jgi:hypothetical protein
MQGLTMSIPPRLADRVTALASSVDFCRFTAIFSPLMFFLNENLWPTMTLGPDPARTPLGPGPMAAIQNH